MKIELPTMSSLLDCDLCGKPLFQHVQERDNVGGGKVTVLEGDAGIVQHMAQGQAYPLELWPPAVTFVEHYDELLVGTGASGIALRWPDIDAEWVLLRTLAIQEPTDFASVTGMGVTGKIGGKSVALGNAKLMADLGIAVGDLEHEADELRSGGATALFLAVDGKPGGVMQLPTRSSQRRRRPSTA